MSPVDNVIAIDTATESLSLGLRTRRGLLELRLKVGFRHGETLVSWVQTLCQAGDIAPGDLDLVVVGIGPGSFTGLRIGMASAKGLARGANCDIVGVPTLEAQAWGFRNLPVRVLSVVDARKGRLYAALYEEGAKKFGPLDVSAEALIERLKPTRGISKHAPLLLTGPFADDLGRDIENRSVRIPFAVDPGYNTIDPHSLLERGLVVYQHDGDHGEALVPLYLRKSEAEIKRSGKYQ